MNELLIIKYILDINKYREYKEYINVKFIKDTYTELYYIYQCLFSLFEKTERSVSLQELHAYFNSCYPDADKAVYDMLFKRIDEEAIGGDVAELLLKDLKVRQQALLLAEQALSVHQGKAKPESLSPFIESINSAEAAKDDFSPVTLDLEELLNSTYAKPGLRWRLNCLNLSLGSLRRGDFGFLFARPETGKTTFLASEVSSFIDQLGEDDGPVIWLNNEEDGKKVAIRVYQAYFGVPLDKLQSNFSAYRNKFLQATEGKFLMFDRATISKWDVERLVDRYSPSVVIYDQIDKITGFSADREDLVLGKKYQWARELAKNSHAAIGVCQADGTAENVRYLTMEHVANAKTAKQAEADWILGIGCIHEDAYAKTRFLNISKNKLLGDISSKPEYKHGKFDVLINPAIARYEDFINYG